MSAFLLGRRQDILFFRSHIAGEVHFLDLELPDWNIRTIDQKVLDLIIMNIGSNSIVPVIGLRDFDYLLRAAIFNMLLLRKVALDSYIFPGYEHLNPKDIGRGTIIMGGSTINPGVSVGIGSLIGECCYIGSGVKIGCTTVLGSFTRIGSFAQIGNETFLAKETSVSSEVTIGCNCHVDQASSIINDMCSGSIVIDRMSITATTKVF